MLPVSFTERENRNFFSHVFFLTTFWRKVFAVFAPTCGLLLKYQEIPGLKHNQTAFKLPLL
jgi:hypothetical protein